MKADFSTKLKEVRTSMGLTQKQLSEKAGISSVSYSAYEMGSKTPPLTIAVKLANAMNVSLDWLCGIEAGGSIRTYADVVRALVSLDSAIQLEYAINDKGPNAYDYARKEVKITLYRDGYDVVAGEADGGLNDYDAPGSLRYKNFLMIWKKTRELIKSGAIDERFFDPWLKDQYAQLNIKLPQYRETVDTYEVEPTKELNRLMSEEE